tara:strand:- start:11 stop:244 length:234 start_codon:yes stop_codon:yes gene_type:complete
MKIEGELTNIKKITPIKHKTDQMLQKFEISIVVTEPPTQKSVSFKGVEDYGISAKDKKKWWKAMDKMGVGKIFVSKR